MADPVTEELLLQAMRKKILREIDREQQASIVNNVYSGGGATPVGGVMQALGNNSGEEEIDPGMFDYFVDIEREPAFHNEAGKPEGWKKKVHRYRKPKGEDPGDPK